MSALPTKELRISRLRHAKARLPRSHALFLPAGEVAGALARIDAPQAAKLAVQFLALTAKRLCEMQRAKWDEMDLEARTFVST